MRIFLQKNEKNIEKNKAAGNEKLPYFTLKRIPEEGETEWKEIAAFWKREKGYSGKLAEGVEVTFKEKVLSDEDKEKLAAIKGINKDPLWD